MAGVVIIGTGFAGYQLARQFRSHDSITPLTLISRDGGCFYSKPMLSKALSMGKSADQLATQSAEQMAQVLDATILVGTSVQSIATEQRLLTYLHHGEQHQLSYSKLVFACGAEVIKLPLDQQAEILHVNDLDDYCHFRHRIHGKQRVALIGAGLIGCEFANDLATNGYQVEVIAPDVWPLSRLLPQKVGAQLQQALEQHGANFHLSQEVVAIEPLSDDGFKLATSSGEIITVDVVLSAVGLRASTALAQAAGIEVGRGIITDRYLMTSAADHFALGDCAEVAGLLCQHIAPIQKAAMALAKTLAGERSAVHYPAMPVVVKTSVYPIMICPWLGATAEQPGEWQFELDSDGSAKGLCHNHLGQPVGFLLTSKRVAERFALEKQMPPWLNEPVA
ncbi:MAG: FAD-dependent oxidoreductase [Gammaproteobacteria bacterium]|nr:FAD-dependent oxidoreductase [Gammaproteobacteria bacterium]